MLGQFFSRNATIPSPSAMSMTLCSLLVVTALVASPINAFSPAVGFNRCTQSGAFMFPSRRSSSPAVLAYLDGIEYEPGSATFPSGCCDLYEYELFLQRDETNELPRESVMCLINSVGLTFDEANLIIKQTQQIGLSHVGHYPMEEASRYWIELNGKGIPCGMVREDELY